MKKSLKIAAANLGAVIALAATLALPTFLAGCRSVEVENYGEEVLKDANGAPILVDGKIVKCSKGWSVDHNSHWVNSDADAISASVDPYGVINFSMNGMKSSPSEEFNKTMQTYTTAFVQLAQIAAAAYNPSASGVVKSQGESAQAATASGGGSASPTVVVNAGSTASGQQQGTTASTNAAECVECTIK